jgi:hypothetical protein
MGMNQLSRFFFFAEKSDKQNSRYCLFNIGDADPHRFKEIRNPDSE